MVDECVRKEINTYNRIKDKKKIIRINFDNFATQTQYNINKLCNFLDLKNLFLQKKL